MFSSSLSLAVLEDIEGTSSTSICRDWSSWDPESHDPVREISHADRNSVAPNVSSHKPGAEKLAAEALQRSARRMEIRKNVVVGYIHTLRRLGLRCYIGVERFRWQGDIRIRGYGLRYEAESAYQKARCIRRTAPSLLHVLFVRSNSSMGCGRRVVNVFFHAAPSFLLKRNLWAVAFISKLICGRSMFRPSACACFSNEGLRRFRLAQFAIPG